MLSIDERLEYERRMGARVFLVKCYQIKTLAKSLSVQKLTGDAWEKCVFGQIRCCQEASNLIDNKFEWKQYERDIWEYIYSIYSIY